MDHIKEGFVWAIMFAPLTSFAIIALVSFLGLTKSRDGRPAVWSARYSGYVTILAILISFALSLWAFASVADEDGHAIGFAAHEWLTIGPLTVNIGINLDGLTGVMLLNDGHILGGDASFYYLGSYTSENGRWKGQILNQEHTPSLGDNPVFGGHAVGIGFSGTCDEEGALVEATALAGKRSLRLTAVLKLMRRA